MQQISLVACHQILSNSIGALNQMELALLKRLQAVYGGDIEKFALFAKLAVQLDAKGLGATLVKI